MVVARSPMTKMQKNHRKQAALEASEFRYEVLKDGSDKNIGTLMEILSRAMPEPGDRSENVDDKRSQISLAKKCLTNALKFSKIERRRTELILASECISRVEFFYRDE